MKNKIISTLWRQGHSILNPIVVLPDKIDFSGKFFIKEISQVSNGSVLLAGERISGNNARIEVDISVFDDKNDAMCIYNDYLPSYPSFLGRSFSGKKLGEKIFTTKVDDLNHTFRRIVVLDGLSVVMITMTGQAVLSGGQPVRLRDNTIQKHALYQDDTALMEKLMVRMLERLTALGVTSKPSSSAPEGARQYIRAKKQNPPRSRKVETSG
jgi:hypothetical protein